VKHSHGTDEPETASSEDGSTSAPGSGRREPTGVYRRGKTVWRVTESVEGGLKVEVLTDGVWVAGPVNMVGLRLDSATSKLTKASIDALPA
jgi:hypothetical protein